MSEYWKSTPKYWCKHCKTFVRDTKLEKTNHEATPKHQGNLKRFLRDLHKGHEREEREKQRAKDEVDRLNGVVSGTGSKAPPWERKSAIPAASASRQATPADRKKQLAQLAELGVAVPEDFRKEMAMVGDWQTTSERLIYDNAKKEEDGGDIKPEGLNIGVRKRKFEGQEEEEEAGERVVRRGWGSTVRAYPGQEDDKDLDALLTNTKILKREGGIEGSVPTEPSSRVGGITNDYAQKEASLVAADGQVIKRENSTENVVLPDGTPEKAVAEAPTIKQEDDAAATGVVFKKRKAKPIRQK
ncbi:hypothetical protein JMJ35_007854 [Cladonia borealis]|uniref:U1-type domain-containing protein n=1 Tax=Cladonia borealis TaxID=184061 RepID=A0AA39V743_9LECA|nr:hypothetical protein JMJ35_007854 [Cladonia borealis]